MSVRFGIVEGHRRIQPMESRLLRIRRTVPLPDDRIWTGQRLADGRLPSVGGERSSGGPSPGQRAADGGRTKGFFFKDQPLYSLSARGPSAESLFLSSEKRFTFQCLLETDRIGIL